MWQENLEPIDTLYIVHNFEDDIDFAFSDTNYIEVDTDDDTLSLKQYNGEYSTDWVYADLPSLVGELETGDVTITEDFYGWEKIDIECSGQNDGDIELWERHHASSSGTEWTEWKKLSEIIERNFTIYLTHIRADGDKYDGIQFRFMMRGDDVDTKCFDIERITLYPIISQNWYYYQYFEPEFPVSVTVEYDERKTTDLPVIYAGDTPRFKFRILQTNGEFVDLTDITVYFKAKERYLEEEYIFEKECTILDAEYGLCESVLLSSETETYGDYLAELSCVYGSSGKLVLQNFPLRINPKV